MILESLQPDPSGLDAGFVMLRAVTHVAMLGAAGLALFGLGFGAQLAREDQERLRRWLLGLALAGIALNAGALPLRVLVLTAGESAFDGAVLGAVMASRNGDAFWIRMAALAALAVAAIRPGRAAGTRWPAPGRWRWPPPTPRSAIPCCSARARSSPRW